MTYIETLDYLYQQLPMFTRVGASAYREDLTNTLQLCERLGNPQHRFKSIHIAGTNGKGSTSHMLAAVLQMAGYKTGLYTSPHLRDFRERIRIDGEMISEESVISFVAAHIKDFEEIQPSFFEMSVGLAFELFEKEKVDFAIIEVGLGGRLDSTNIISPILSLITNIGWDHMNLLGNSLQLIAKEKAGIIKPFVPVVIGEFQEEIAIVFKEKAALENATLCFASEEWEILKLGNKITPHSESTIEVTIKKKDNTNKPLADQPILHLNLDLTGTYQLKNLKNVLSALEELRKQDYIITDEHIFSGLSQVKALTGLMGRWHTLGKHPLVIADTGHNVDGIREVLINIEETPHEHLHFVIGMVNDKDINKILSLLPKLAVYYFCKPAIPRGLDAEHLKKEASKQGLIGDAYPSVGEALSAAKNSAGKNDLIFIGGSTFVVAEVV